jgi:guanylate kinase
MYDYVIINDKIEAALGELDAVVTASALRTANIEHRFIERHFLKEDD